jgi:hypothetical protein
LLEKGGRRGSLEKGGCRHQKSSMGQGRVGHQTIVGEGRAPPPGPGGMGRRGDSVLFDVW